MRNKRNSSRNYKAKRTETFKKKTRIRRRQLIYCTFQDSRKELKILIKGGKLVYQNYPICDHQLSLEQHEFDINTKGVPRYVHTTYVLESQEGNTTKSVKRNTAGWIEQREGEEVVRHFIFSLFFVKYMSSKKERKRALIVARKNCN